VLKKVPHVPDLRPESRIYGHIQLEGLDCVEQVGTGDDEKVVFELGFPNDAFPQDGQGGT
jgi:hypothetical protein